MSLPKGLYRGSAPAVVRRAARLVFLFSLCLYGATTGGSMATDIMAYEVTKGIVERGSVAMSYNLFEMEAHRGIDGRYYSPYGLGHALYSAPFYLLGRTAERFSGGGIGRSESLRKGAMTVGSAVAAAASVWLTFWFAWALVGQRRPAVMAALALGCATAMWPYAKFGFNAPLATLCVLTAVYGAWVGVRFHRLWMLVLSGAGIGAALLVRHELVLVSLPIVLWLILESWPDIRRAVRTISVIAMPAVVAVMITAYYNWIRFGNLFDTGYLRDQTAVFGSFWQGVVGLTVSPGGSLFLYSPLLLLGIGALNELRKEDRHTAILLTGVTLVLFCFYASLGHWDADRSYGPRYLLPLTPFLCIPLARWFDTGATGVRQKIVMAGLVVSMLVQLPGVLVDFSKVGHTPEIGYQTRNVRRWEWQYSALVLNTRAAVSTVPQNIRYLAGVDKRPSTTPAMGLARNFSAQFAYSLDFWWVYLYFLGVISAEVTIILGLLSFGLTGAVLIRLWKT